MPVKNKPQQTGEANTEAKKRIYVGQGKKFQNGGRKISICLDEIPGVVVSLESEGESTGLPNHLYTDKNGLIYAKFWVNDRKESDKYGNDLSVSLDDYKKP